ncbi:peroxiredoxin family protein [Sphingobacterium spiritivorum]|uniref:peroxiredoxin family protein n=1 Tax=Sphingobacterium spiritivorum TaxID=258 RepID=UPI003DA26E98
MKALKPITHIVGFVLILLTSGCTDTLGELPDFKLKKSVQSEVSVSKIIQDKPAMIVHFDADCKGCQDEAEGIVKNLSRFGDINIVFASLQGFDKIDLFDEYFHLSEHKNIIVGQDYSNAIPTHFKTYTTPLIVLIDDNSHIRKVITGEIEMPELIQLLNEIR